MPPVPGVRGSHLHLVSRGGLDGQVLHQRSGKDTVSHLAPEPTGVMATEFQVEAEAESPRRWGCGGGPEVLNAPPSINQRFPKPGHVRCAYEMALFGLGGHFSF